MRVMTNPDDTTFGAAAFLFASLAIAYLLWLIGDRIGRFHRAGLRRLARHQRRQEQQQ